MMTLPRLRSQAGRRCRFSFALASVAASALRTGASAQNRSLILCLQYGLDSALAPMESALCTCS